MLLAYGLQQYARSRQTPERRTISIGLMNNISLALDIPDFGVSQIETKPNALARVLLSHAAFRVSMQPEQESAGEGFLDLCAAEVNAISLLFPDLQSDSIHICFAAWLAFVCLMDDLLETLPFPEQEAVLIETIEIVLSRPTHVRINPLSAPTVRDKRIQALAKALVDHCSHHLSSPTVNAFFRAAANVLQAHIDEVRFLEGRIQNDLSTYLSVRSRTIALDPFFEVLKREYLPVEWQFNTAWDNLQLEIGCSAGLQNDLIGLGKDLETGEQLNAVIVLLRALRGNLQDTDKTLLTQCIDLVTTKHNQSVLRALNFAEEIIRSAETASPNVSAAVSQLTRHILLLTETHLRWCTKAKRYQTKSNDGNPWIQDNKLPVTPSVTQMVQPKGIIHGLPVYTPPSKPLTALITGSTGVSGYQMLKTLFASPDRWAKIYCLSSRPPPTNFFPDLGPSSTSRVHHIQVNFLTSTPSEISHILSSQIPEQIDHIFYFSYHQPPPPSNNVLDLWANQDQLSTVNTTMFNNFLSALSSSPKLIPKKFLLQTGTKHYGFYLGPASIPAFETDPRVTLSHNFYYDQEDSLASFCTTNPTCKYVVARPSYIIGAVRDGTLNHLLGIGIYVSIQRYLGQKIQFPGGYDAWTREQVQSSAALNSYFEEWCVLNDGVENGARFNIHDGGCFTWGRAWEMLGRWYGVDWEVPGEEEEGYRVLKMVGGCPRGYGPQATVKSTFTLLEWSLQPEVEAAWKELSAEHGLVLDPFDDQYRARIFSFADSALIGDAPMTTSIAKARKHGFFGTVDSYHSIFQTLHDLAKLKLIVAPVAEEYGL
ncbi:Iridoid synthase [Podospora fimiseda]|uniref:Iridoid synthase n=1 Tax=Podospora fimiseda TaxID=252190 RepID=A0AAN6YSX7_9PEZI|nr:Iridoid synthase [Podospora fimiseda]